MTPDAATSAAVAAETASVAVASGAAASATSAMAAAAAAAAASAPAPAPAAPFSREQFRMARLQVFNWGTFNDLHEVPISERGFLIVGRSGAGKSTLLDAFSALLVPPRWVDFNAAAREADRAGRDRNLVSYVRGAWAAQSDASSGEYTTRYLRSGTTWSALALNYQNALGQQVTLVQLFWLRGGANGNTDVKRYFLIFERAFDLRELSEFGDSNFDVRKLKQSFPEAHARDEFRPYCERFCRLLGIDSEMALRLLHKTQSAKNLGDLNAFLRDFMLDKPETFAVADRLVSEFGELNAAHQAVVTARQQVQMLVPARERHQQMQSIQLQRNGHEELRAGMHSYRERRRMALLETALAALAVELDGHAGQMRRQQDTLDNRNAALRDLEHQRRLRDQHPRLAEGPFRRSGRRPRNPTLARRLGRRRDLRPSAGRGLLRLPLLHPEPRRSGLCDLPCAGRA